MKSDKVESSKTKQQRILLVNNEKNIRTVLSDILRMKGYLVKGIKDGYKAIEAVEKENFDLAIIELRMPWMSGIKVLENIKRKNPQIPVIISTEYRTTTTAIEVMKKGAYDYLVLHPLNEFIVNIEKVLRELESKESKNQ